MLALVHLGCEKINLNGEIKSPFENVNTSKFSISDGLGSSADQVTSLSLLTTDGDVQVFALEQDASGSFLSNPEVAWTLIGSFADLTIQDSGRSAVLNNFSAGSGQIKFEYDDRTVAINVDVSVPPTPTANSDTIYLIQDTLTEIDVLVNDTDAAENLPLAIDSVSTPTNGTAVIDGGVIDYTPSAGYLGTDSFTYTVSNASGGTETGTVNIYVMTAHTWTGAGADDLWTNSDNWCGTIVAHACTGGSAPSSSQVAVFNDTCENCDAQSAGSISVGGISMATTYNGTITQNNGHNLTVGSSSFTQKGGTFVGGNSTIDIQEDFVLEGGTFTSTSGTMQVRWDIQMSGGTFIHNSGKIDSLASADGQVVYLRFLSGNLYDLDFSRRYNATAYIQSNFEVENLLSLTNNHVGTKVYGGYTISVHGNVDVGRGTVAAGRNTMYTVKLIGTGDQTIRGVHSTVDWNKIPHLIVDKPSGSVLFTGNGITYRGDFNVINGDLELTGRSPIFDVNFENGEASIHNLNNEVVGSLTLVIDYSNTINFYGDLNVSGDLTITSNRGNTVLQSLDGGKIYVGGDFAFGSSYGLPAIPANMKMPLVFNGSSNQNYSSGGTITSSDNFDADVTVNKSNGKVIQTDNFYTAAGYDLIIDSGEWEIRNKYTLSVGSNLSVASGTTIDQGCGTLNYGSLSNSGSITTSSSSPFVTAVDASVNEGGVLMMRVLLSEGYCTGDFIVDYTVADITTTSVADYIPPSGTLTVTDGSKIGVVGIPAVSDGVAETDETLSFTIDTITAGIIGTATSTGTISD